jgi:hypothetical protein
VSKWADDNGAGEHAYVVTRWNWGRETHRIEYAANLAEAKRHYGWTRELHTSIKVRRATQADVEAYS